MSPFAVRFLGALLAVLVVAIGIDNLGRALANPDEGRYSEISREMAATGDWVTPRLNGIKYFEKPPLQYWATALSFELFGESEYSARFYVALCGLLTLLLTAYTASRLGVAAGTGLATALALASSPYFMMMGGVVTLDTGLTWWTTLTLCAYLLAERPGTRPGLRRRWMLVAWAGIACGNVRYVAQVIRSARAQVSSQTSRLEKLDKLIRDNQQRSPELLAATERWGDYFRSRREN